jgi:cell division protein ZapD
VTTEYLNFEQPLTERMRMFLRVEHLAHQVEYFKDGEETNESRVALSSLVELFSLFERNDIKGEIIKELERHIQRLQRLQGFDGIDNNQLHSILNELQYHSGCLQQLNGKLGQVLREDELLNSVRQRLAIPGGTCCFDTPIYYYWLNTPLITRQTLFQHWLTHFTPLSQALELLLKLIRDSADPQTEIAHQGFYQKTLDMNSVCPMLQVKVNKTLGVYPEISGGKYRVNIRFWQFAPTAERATPCSTDIPFQVRCCVI